MCQAIATKTEKILQQQRYEYALEYWKKANNIASYVNMWSDRVKSQGGDPLEVEQCTRKFNQTVYKNNEGMGDELLKKDNARMTLIDAKMFEILVKDMKQETMEKYVKIVQSISETELKTSKNEGDTLLKTKVNAIRSAYELAANCLRNLMLKVDAMIV